MKRQVFFAKGRTNAQVQMAMRARSAYLRARILFESMRQGEGTYYAVPQAYDGRRGLMIEDEPHPDAPTVECVWLRISEKIAKLRVTPEIYFDVVFGHFAGKTSQECGVEPQQLLSDSMTSLFPRLLKEFESEFALALEIQQRQASNAIRVLISSEECESMDAAVADVVLDVYVELSPLFRYCLAQSAGTPAALKAGAAWRKEASTQFERYRILYLKHWKAVLPPSWVAAS